MSGALNDLSVVLRATVRRCLEPVPEDIRAAGGGAYDNGGVGAGALGDVAAAPTTATLLSEVLSTVSSVVRRSGEVVDLIFDGLPAGHVYSIQVLPT